MNISSKLLLLISATAYTIPFVAWGIVNALFPLDPIMDENMQYQARALDEILFLVNDIGSWTGLVTFVLGVLSWKK